MLTIETLKKIYGKIWMIENNNSILFFNNIYNDGINYDVKLSYFKCKKIINLIEILGFKITDNKILDISINKTDLEKSKDKIIKLIDNEFKVLFELKKMNVNYIEKVLGKNEDSNKKFLGFLNGLLNEYGFTIDVVRKNRKINNNVIAKYIYKLNFNEALKVMR